MTLSSQLFKCVVIFLSAEFFKIIFFEYKRENVHYLFPERKMALPLLLIAVFVGVARANKTVCNPRTEVFTKCEPRCQATCQRPTAPIYSTSHCETFACNPGCVCAEGYVRDREGGKCVPRDACKGFCAPNQAYKSCGSTCPPTCSGSNFNPCTKQCVAGCYCKEDFVAEDYSWECLQPCKCPQNDK